MLERRNNRTAPVIVCDTCEKHIEMAELGMVMWFAASLDDNDFNPLFVHKGACLETLAATRARGRSEKTMELVHFLTRLSFNSGVDVKDAEESLNRLQDLP